jgi:hypothetical protein
LCCIFPSLLKASSALFQEKRFCFTNLIINLNEYESAAICIWQKKSTSVKGKLESMQKEKFRHFVDSHSFDSFDYKEDRKSFSLQCRGSFVFY